MIKKILMMKVMTKWINKVVKFNKVVNKVCNIVVNKAKN